MRFIKPPKNSSLDFLKQKRKRICLISNLVFIRNKKIEKYVRIAVLCYVAVNNQRIVDMIFADVVHLQQNGDQDNKFGQNAFKSILFMLA